MSFIIMLSTTTSSSAFETYYRNDSFAMAKESSDPYLKTIQPILDKRCVACHSCREAECRLKLTSSEGFQRGGTKELIHGSALKSVQRTKLFDDAQTIDEWRDKGFYSVMDTPNYMKKFQFDNYSGGKLSILTSALTNKFNPNLDNKDVNLLGTEAQSCGDGNKDLSKVPGMPYRMAALDFKNEFMPLYKWAQQGSNAYFPNSGVLKEMKTPHNPELIKKWERFFNNPSSKGKWTSRFLYEHLFLSRFYFEEAPGEFFELIRSSTRAPQDIKVLPTVHAWENPGKKTFYYRLRKVHSSIVFKNHMVYKVNDSILEELKDNFWYTDWGRERNVVSFNFKISNPLVAFKHMPAKSRYSWMLKNAHMLLDVSARAQNCRSVGAASPYWDNMLHIFVRPDADATVVYDKKFYDEAGKYLPIPNLTGGKKNPFTNFKKAQNKYVKVKRKYQDKLRPNGFKLEDIWDGEGVDKNAIVTVLRHEWTASAHKGQMGQGPRSVLLMDFAKFERYFYLCNVATEVSDGMLWQSRVVTYLFDTKRESEDQFLSFIPKKYRRLIRKNLVQGFDVDKEFVAPFALPYNKDSDKIKIDPRRPFNSFVKNLLSTHFTPDVIGKNSYSIKHFETEDDDTLRTLEELSTLKGFPAFIPNVSYLRIEDEYGESEFYTLAVNRYFKSRNKLSLVKSNIEYEKSKRVPRRDRLDVYKGIIVNYPEKIYTIKADQLHIFLQDLHKVNSREKFLTFNNQYGLSQTAENFWSVIDDANSKFISNNPITGGIIDLHKYGSKDTEAPL